MKSALKGLAVIILIGVSVCFSVIYYNTFIRDRVFAENDGESEGVQTVPTPTPTDQEENKPDEVFPDPVIPVFRTEFPRNANKLLDGFINNVGGYGIETLYDCYKLGERYTAIFGTTSDNCDIRENGSGIAIANFDQSGTLLNTYSLQADRREKYLSSSLYDNGILIVTTNQTNVIIHSIAIDGSVNRLNLSLSSDKAITYYTSIGTLVACFTKDKIQVFCVGASLSVIYNFSFSAEGMTDPVALFKSGNFVLFANGANSGKIFSFDLSGNSTSINLPTIKDVIPTSEGYLIATKSSGKIFLNRYSYNLQALGTTELASGENVKLAVSETGYFALTFGGETPSSSYFLCKHFDTVSINRSDYLGFSDVREVITIKDKIFFVSTLRGTSYIYEYNVNNHVARPILQLQNSEDLRFFLTSRSSGGEEIYTLTTFFSSTNTIGDYANNFGSSDVWMRRTELG